MNWSVLSYAAALTMTSMGVILLVCYVQTRLERKKKDGDGE